MNIARPIPREAVLIVNAHSRRGAELFRDARAKLEMAGIRLIAAHGIKDPSKLDEAVQLAVADGAPMVIVGGGDGSLSSAVDFLVDRNCVFALLPLGTANSFARTLGLPLDLDAAIDTIVNGRRKRVDVGAINGDYFVNSAAIGLSPMVGASVPHGLKKWLGRFGYLLWALWCLIRFKSFELIVDDGREVHRLKALEVRIANGSFHGGVEVVDDANIDSGEIIVQAVIGHARRALIWSWFSTIFRLPARAQTVCDFRGSRLQVTTHPSLPISIDGEVCARTPVTVEVAERAIEVVVPAERPASA